MAAPFAHSIDDISVTINQRLGEYRCMRKFFCCHGCTLEMQLNEFARRMGGD